MSLFALCHSQSAGRKSLIQWQLLTLGCFGWTCSAQISVKPLIPSIPWGSSSAWNHICRLTVFGINILAFPFCLAQLWSEVQRCYVTAENHQQCFQKRWNHCRIWLVKTFIVSGHFVLCLHLIRRRQWLWEVEKKKGFSGEETCTVWRHYGVWLSRNVCWNVGGAEKQTCN